MDEDLNNMSMVNFSETLIGMESSQNKMKLLDLISFIIFFIVMIIGLIGNSLVIYVVLRYFKMQTVTNFYIANLAIADEVFLISIPFVLITMWLRRWPFGNIVCKMYWTVTSTNQFTSSLLLTVMSADRYMAVCHPLRCGRWRTLQAARLFCGVAWSVSALMVVPLLVYARDESGRCDIFWPDTVGGLSGPAVFTLYTFIVTFALPMSAVIFFYSCVLLRLRAPVSNVSASQPKVPATVPRASPPLPTVPDQNRELSEGNPNMNPRNGTDHISAVSESGPAADKNKRASLRPIERRRSKRRRRVTRLVLAIILVYFFCYLPFWVTHLWLLAQTVDQTATKSTADESGHGNNYSESGLDSSNATNVRDSTYASGEIPVTITSSPSYFSSSEQPQQQNQNQRKENNPDNKNQRSNRSTVVFIFMLAFALTYCNSAINPVLYTFLSENFRTTFGKAFRRSQQNEANCAVFPDTAAPVQQQNKRRLQEQQQRNHRERDYTRLLSGGVQAENPISNYEMSVNKDNGTTMTSLVTPRHTAAYRLSATSDDSALSAESTLCKSADRGSTHQTDDSTKTTQSTKESLLTKLVAIKNMNTWV